MSYQAVRAVLDRPEPKGIDRLALIVIAEHADDQGGNAWPSFVTIAREAAISPRHAKRVIARLSDGGHLVVRAGKGRYQPNTYAIPCVSNGDSATAPLRPSNGDKAMSHLSAQPMVTPGVTMVTSGASMVTPGASNGDTAMSPESSNHEEPPKNHHLSPDGGDDESFLVWAEGKKISREDAAKCIAHRDAGKITGSLKAFTLACQRNGEFPDTNSARTKLRPKLPLIERQKLEVMRREPQFKAWMAETYPGHEASPQKCKEAAITEFFKAFDIPIPAEDGSLGLRPSQQPPVWDPMTDNACAPSRRSVQKRQRDHIAGRVISCF